MIPYAPEDLDADFRKDHSDILSIKRGNGLWLWKPYVVLKTLERVNYGDYVFYCDSGAFFISSVEPLIQSMGNYDVWVSDIGFVEEQWTKPEVFRLLKIEDRDDIKKSRQVQASFVLCRKSEYSVKFIRAWLNLCSRTELIMPLQEGEEHGECIEHRDDQSLLSVCSKLHEIPAHREPYLSPVHSHPKLIIRFIKAKLTGQVSSWAKARSIPDSHDDKYHPCIYHHRIRCSGKMSVFVMKVFYGMGLVRSTKFIFSVLFR